ncbi:hypothetical protein KY092_07985 [Natronomonas gomsonensis]|uniref:hypothetical protein n=1 Tax=Natronomonas gomsonensis TaxID=1046043 RepID=UPI0020CA3AA6|nr:hypothetical protein [Natronomonas gomsonensis]MCY4730496.1 hypothetical protein [Natronomonas gomsonensis]
MSEATKEYEVNPQHFLDSVTKEITEVLLENPKIAYNRSSLAEAAGVSRDALYRRWDSFKDTGLIEEAEVESETDHWRLNSDSSIADNLGSLLYDLRVGEKSRMQEHLVGLDVEEVQNYVERTLSDDRLDEFGGAEDFLDAVESAERDGENRDDVLEFVEEKRQGETSSE